MSARAEMSASAPRRQHERRREGRWRRSCTRGVVMMRFALVLMALVLLGTATEAPAACRRFGTQLECDLGGSQLLIGTQAAPAPAHTNSLRPQLLQGGDLDDRPPPPRPLPLEFQNVRVDPSLCPRRGNQT